MLGKDKETVENLKLELQHLRQIIEKIQLTVTLAEDWSDRQLMPESSITMSALKDIRRIVRTSKLDS